MAGAQGDPRKWHLPGWRIEQRYANGVLIGNWAEERLTFQKGSHKHNSTQRIDFRNFGSHRPDVLIRRNREQANRGLPADIFFYHHGKAYLNNMVSSYDEDFNGRFRENNLPSLRKWNTHKVGWIPEKSDHPVSAPPTNFGLLGQQQKKWAAQIADETRGDYLSTYTVSYEDVPDDARVKMCYATPKSESTSLHPVNHTLKDLHLRGGTILKSPEKLPAELLPPQKLPSVSC